MEIRIGTRHRVQMMVSYFLMTICSYGRGYLIEPHSKPFSVFD